MLKVGFQLVIVKDIHTLNSPTPLRVPLLAFTTIMEITTTIVGSVCIPAEFLDLRSIVSNGDYHYNLLLSVPIITINTSIQYNLYRLIFLTKFNLALTFTVIPCIRLKKLIRKAN